VLEQSGQRHEAAVAYLRAVNTAQAQGRWLSDATTAPGLREAVKHATQYIKVARREVFDAVIAPLR
jgi:aspartate beta-hydroxylase